VRLVGSRPLHLGFPYIDPNSPRRLTPGAEGLTNPGTAAPKFPVSQFAIIEF